VFALGIMPYISASIFVQIAGAVIPQVEKMQKDEEGRKKINQWTRYATVFSRRCRRGASRSSRIAARVRSPIRRWRSAPDDLLPDRRARSS
jgi:hypothetical protein